MKRFLILFITVLILLPSMSPARPVTDANLQNCIGSAAGKSYNSLSGRELLEITVLECAEMGIASIEGLENLANLVELNLNDNRIADISPLAGLERLTKLYLWHNRIADISPVAGLRQLQELYLWGNEIEDIGPLAGLVMLQELLLGDNRIADLKPLAGLVMLDYLEIFNNGITDITPLQGLTRLEKLDGSGNSISDVSALRNLVGLNRLSLNGNSISSIKALAGLKSLKTLLLGYNMIGDISGLARLPELRILDLNANRIADMAPLRALVSLERVTLDNNLVSNVEPLVGLPNLAHVSLLNNCINTIGGFAQADIITGMEYQHDLCGSPNLVKRTITPEWLNEQIGGQCVDFDGENDYSLKADYKYYTDGIYYEYYARNNRGEVSRAKACRLPWNSSINDFLIALEKTESPADSYEVLRFAENNIYVKDGRIKGYSVNNRHKVGSTYTVLDDIYEQFGVRYSLKKSRDGSYEFLTEKVDGYVVRIVDMGEKYSLQFFEPGFYAVEMAQPK